MSTPIPGETAVEEIGSREPATTKRPGVDAPEMPPGNGTEKPEIPVPTADEANGRPDVPNLPDPATPESPAEPGPKPESTRDPNEQRS